MLIVEVRNVMKNTFNDNAYSKTVEMAHLRFSVVARPYRGCSVNPAKAYYKEYGKPLVLPDGTERFYNYSTFEKWSRPTRKGNGRSNAAYPLDAGTQSLPTLRLPSLRLKEQFPKINATLIYNAYH